MIFRLLFLILILPISCTAENIDCKYSASFVDEKITSNKNIKNTKWEKYLDTDSGEHIKKLSITFNNNNTAIVEHKYCDIYNFEYTIKLKDKILNKADIAKQITYAFQYSEIQPKFKTDLNTIILNALNSQQFNSEKDLSIGLPTDQILYDDSVEYGLEYSSNHDKNPVSSIIFYLSIGGI